MKKEEKKLLLFLLEQKEEVTAVEISNEINRSIRSVKNYIASLNTMSKERMIISSKKGYKVNVPVAKTALEYSENIPQYYEERAIYIIQKILVENIHPDVFDLCEELFIAYSTLKSTIKKMNVTFEKFKVSFYTKNNKIFISGRENDKRKLLSNVIFKETSNSVLDIKTLNDSFGEDFVFQLTGILKNNFSKFNYKLNDFAFANFLLHMSILVDRVLENNQLEETSRNLSKFADVNDERALEREITKDIENHFHITLNPMEESEIYLWLKMNTNYLIPVEKDAYVNAIGESTFLWIEDILNRIDKIYSIQLNSEAFLLPFGLHITSLINRSKIKKWNKNPLLGNIKKEFPIIYDIAVFISLELCKEYDIELIDDEISFIAIHVGAEIDRQKINSEKLQCILLCPEYIDMRPRIQKYLLDRFGEDISIKKIVSSHNEVPNNQFDVLFTTVEDEQNFQFNFFPLLPFSLEKQESEIHEWIKKSKEIKSHNVVQENFDNYFMQEFFYVQENRSQEEIIHLICSDLLKYHIVPQEFEKNVLEREKISSTGFGEIAIPHSIYMNAIQTRIAVCICPDGVKWGDTIVYIIWLMAINQIDNLHFPEIYEYILKNVDKPNFLENIRNIRSFQELKKWELEQ